ncbi:MAG TPA: hypothetical protein DEV85_04515 [Vibrio sp.]|uniref:restriction endonuclease subunit S n=1 Tax=Vibrio sp. TaxID=678 RepID=UPI000EDA23EF|nr:restriction endonuclease subunit S [Vibrio sp.]HCH01141.1 hypothetical protein [Vibrio sp.]
MEYKDHAKYIDANDIWLDKYPVHWTSRKLKFAVRLINEKIDSKESQLEYLGLEHIESWTGKKIQGGQEESDGLSNIFKAGDVLFGKLRPYLAKVYKAETDGLASSEALILRTCELTNPNYLKYFLLTPSFIDVVNGSTYGVKMPRASWDFIGQLSVLLPPFEEQQKIARFLDYKTQQIDQLIEKKKALIEKLEEQRIAVITQAVTKGIDKNAKLKPSGVDWLGDVPEHWDVRRLKFMASIQNGRDYKEVEVEEGGYPVYGSGGEFRRASQYLYDGESVLFGRKGTIDKPLYVNCRFWTVDTMFYSEILTNTIAKFLYYSALTFQYQKLSTQTALPSITQHDLENYILTYPCKEEQLLIVNFLDEQSRKIKEMITVIKKAIEKLEEYRSAIITSAVTGKIDVRNIAIPEALDKDL